MLSNNHSNYRDQWLCLLHNRCGNYPLSCYTAVGGTVIYDPPWLITFFQLVKTYSVIEPLSCMLNADFLTLQSYSVYRYKRNVATLGFSCVETKNKGFNTLEMVPAFCCNGVIVFGVFRVHCSCLILGRDKCAEISRSATRCTRNNYTTEHARTHTWADRRTDSHTHTHTHTHLCVDRQTHTNPF
jgi:hypothetical protein